MNHLIKCKDDMYICTYVHLKFHCSVCEGRQRGGQRVCHRRRRESPESAEPYAGIRQEENGSPS
jgi:hypothetical protein